MQFLLQLVLIVRFHNRNTTVHFKQQLLTAQSTHNDKNKDNTECKNITHPSQDRRVAHAAILCPWTDQVEEQHPSRGHWLMGLSQFRVNLQPYEGTIILTYVNEILGGGPLFRVLYLLFVCDCHMYLQTSCGNNKSPASIMTDFSRLNILLQLLL